MDLDAIGSCASRSDSLTSLSYSMVVFSTKSFGIFQCKGGKSLVKSLKKMLNGKMLVFNLNHPLDKII